MSAHSFINLFNSRVCRIPFQETYSEAFPAQSRQHKLDFKQPAPRNRRSYPTVYAKLCKKL